MPLGEEARTVKAGLRITKHEQDALSATFGSEGKGLRVLLDHWVAATSPSTAMAVAAMHETNRVARDIIDAGPAVEEALEQIHDTYGTKVTVVDTLPMAGTATAATQGIAAFPVADIPVDVPVHRHKRKTKIATEFDHGTKVEVWACECGQEMR
jgi:hypothetical protein